ncbi:MAG: dihydroorotate dehydrogenase [Thermoplasmata archaeon]|nr:dihydroorotate dehydrogenase [Thermoplasmata archaeon]
MADLKVTLAGIPLRNPFLLASGIWGESGSSLAGAYAAGAGGVITKSIGREPRPGYPNPTVVTFDQWGFLNAMGLPNPGIESYPEEVATARKSGALVIGSVFGPDAAEFADLAGRMADLGVAGLELNLSCPHAEGLGSEVGQDPADVEEITRAVVRAVKIPVIVKLTPNTSDPAGLAEAAERAGAAAVSAINTLRALAIDVRLRRPTLAHGLGGLSGSAIKPIGVACVWQIFERVKIPVIGVGGIMTAEDALEYIMAGARAVEVGTAVAFKGIRVFGDLVRDLGRLLDELGIASVNDAVGMAHRVPA